MWRRISPVTEPSWLEVCVAISGDFRHPVVADDREVGAVCPVVAVQADLNCAERDMGAIAVDQRAK
jgi:hypothetical protein